MAILEDSGPYGSPNCRPDHSGSPTLQKFSEAMDRCIARRKWQEEHPDEMMGPGNWDQIMKDHADIERGEGILGCCGGRTFEPGDGFVFKGQE